MKICKYNVDGNGWCEIIQSYCVESPCEYMQMVEYQPVKRGKWEEHDAEDMMKCPFCGDEWNYIDNDCYRFNYCPNCGAKMEEQP